MPKVIPPQTKKQLKADLKQMTITDAAKKNKVSYSYAFYFSHNKPTRRTRPTLNCCPITGF